MVIASKLKSGEVVSGYYDNDGLEDRALLLCHLLSDLVMDIVTGNIEDIRAALEEDDDESEG